jgi:hypothetical protein
MPGKWGITLTTGLHGLRSNCMPGACTVRARQVGSRLVPNRTANVDQKGKKPSKPSEASETAAECGLLVRMDAVLSRPRAVRGMR